MSIESHLVSIRTYMEGISNQQAQILAELKRLNGAQWDKDEPRTSEGKPPSGERSSGSTDDAFLAAVTQDTVSKLKPGEVIAVPAGTVIPRPPSKPQTAAEIEKQLEAETGKDFVKTGNQPVTLAESDKPAPGTKKSK